MQNIKNTVSDYLTFNSNPSSTTSKESTLYIKEPYYVQLQPKLIWALSAFSVPALKLFCYILMELPFNQDIIYIDMKKYAATCGYNSTVGVYKGLAELLENQVIYRHVGHKSIYFVNVNLFLKSAA